jgi:phosphomannomutase
MELFGTAGIRGSVGERVTPAFALSVGRAAGDEAVGVGSRAGEDLAARTGSGGGPDAGSGAGRDSGDGDGGPGTTGEGATFVVGRDGRTTGPALAAAVEAGLESAGADVVRAGVLPTPALAFASQGRRGVMLTASHNPPQDNGLKLFVDGVEYDRDRERAVERRVAEDRSPVEWDRWGDARTIDPLPRYRAAVEAYARTIGAPLEGLPIVVDCGNGMGSLATPHVLDRLGAHVVSLNANVDGHFPGRESKPTAASLADLRAFVADGPFAFGVGHDGDADRLAVVDADGEMVHEDTVVAILAEHAVRASDALDPVVVTTPNASARIDERVEAAGGRVERVRLGALHEGIASVRAGPGTVVYAAEPWKHVHPELGGWIDGVATVAVLARLVAAAAPSPDRADGDGTAGESESEAGGTAAAGLDGERGAAGLAALREPVSERPYRKADVDCPDGAKADAMALVAERLPDAFPDADVDTAHGVRLSLPDGAWVLVRPSGTEPYLRLYAEAEDVDELCSRAEGVVEAAVAEATD